MSAIKLTKREKSWIVYDVWQLGIRAAGVDPYPHLLLGDCRPWQLCCSAAWGYATDGGVAFARDCSCRFWVVSPT